MITLLSRPAYQGWQQNQPLPLEKLLLFNKRESTGNAFFGQR
ncbi:phosphoribulokinase [Acetobacter orientalis]|uniref:Phosphoribulokinase n=1 Tax=Acetobacter orientalis TaxID=146474 RepID=A0A2Z5ZE06_9PROT|nr:phosphoribulokinase [Acetobacter orientalis]